MLKFSKSTKLLVAPLRQEEKRLLEASLCGIPTNSLEHLYLQTRLELHKLTPSECIARIKSMPKGPNKDEIIDLMIQGIVFRLGLEPGLTVLEYAKSNNFYPTITTQTILCVGALDIRDLLRYSQYFAVLKRGWWPIPQQIFDCLIDTHLDLYLDTWKQSRNSKFIPKIWQSFRWTRQYQRIQHTFMNSHQLNNLIIAFSLTGDKENLDRYRLKLKRKRLELGHVATIFLQNPRGKWALYDSLFADTSLGKRIMFISDASSFSLDSNTRNIT